MWRAQPKCQVPACAMRCKLCVDHYSVIMRRAAVGLLRNAQSRALIAGAALAATALGAHNTMSGCDAAVRTDPLVTAPVPSMSPMVTASSGPRSAVAFSAAAHPHHSGSTGKADHGASHAAATASSTEPYVKLTGDIRKDMEATVKKVQDDICNTLSAIDGKQFHEDTWVRSEGGE